MCIFQISIFRILFIGEPEPDNEVRVRESHAMGWVETGIRESNHDSNIDCRDAIAAVISAASLTLC